MKTVMVEKIDSEDPKAFKMDFYDKQAQNKEFKTFQNHSNHDKLPYDYPASTAK